MLKYNCPLQVKIQMFALDMVVCLYFKTTKQNWKGCLNIIVHYKVKEYYVKWTTNNKSNIITNLHVSYLHCVFCHRFVERWNWLHISKMESTRRKWQESQLHFMEVDFSAKYEHVLMSILFSASYLLLIWYFTCDVFLSSCNSMKNVNWLYQFSQINGLL